MFCQLHRTPSPHQPSYFWTTCKVAQLPKETRVRCRAFYGPPPTAVQRKLTQSSRAAPSAVPSAPSATTNTKKRTKRSKLDTPESCTPPTVPSGLSYSNRKIQKRPKRSTLGTSESFLPAAKKKRTVTQDLSKTEVPITAWFRPP